MLALLPTFLHCKNRAREQNRQRIAQQFSFYLYTSESCLHRHAIIIGISARFFNVHKARRRGIYSVQCRFIGLWSALADKSALATINRGPTKVAVEPQGGTDFQA